MNSGAEHPDARTDAVVSIRNLSHRFASGLYGLKGIDFQINANEFLLLSGLNGSGKTLLMLHVTGLLAPTSGEISYRGRPIASDIETVRRRIGIVFQNPESQFLGQTVEEDIGFGLEYAGLSEEQIAERTRAAIDEMSIAHLAARRPFNLSGGEQRKAAIAALLARNPEILILDEPFIGLDLPGVRSILGALVEIRKSGRSVVVITHDVEKVLAHVDRVVILREGSVAATGTPEEMVKRFGEFDIRCPDVPVSSMSWLGA